MIADGQGVRPLPEGKSSQIYGVNYNHHMGWLFIQFFHKKKPGAIYRYERIGPVMYEELMQAPSIGQFFNERIKARPSIYPYTKVAEPPPPEEQNIEEALQKSLRKGEESA